MSEYQYYEFQALDRRLTETEMVAIRKLSSRVKLSATSASFVYNFGDLPGQAEDVLENYFDAMLYISNWGSRHLMFRFPKALLPVAAIEPYCVPFTTSVKTTDKYTLLEITSEKEEGEWIDTGEGLLTGMIGLRDAILRGDYRALYLAWLHACSIELELEEDDDDDDESDENVNPKTPEPPVPPNLKQLDAGLEAFIDFFEIDPAWVEVGIADSLSLAQTADPLDQWIELLPEAECRKYLLRVVRGEPNIAFQILAELRLRFGSPAAIPARPDSRTAGALYAAVKKERQRILAEKRQAAEAARLKRLKSLATHEAEMWPQVTAHILRRTSEGYDQAVSLMSELREVAEFQGTQTAFVAHIEQIRQQFSTLRSLLSRMKTSRLIP